MINLVDHTGMYKFFWLVWLILLIVCAPMETPPPNYYVLGLAELEKGNYTMAYSHFADAIGQNDRDKALFYIGLMYLKGFYGDRLDTLSAIYWFQIATSEGSIAARDSLVRLGQEPPPLGAARYKRLMENLEELQRTSSQDEGSSSELNQTQSRRISEPYIQPSNNQYKQKVESYYDDESNCKECLYKSDCGLGENCVKISGRIKGCCGQLVNEFGTPTYNVEMENKVEGCQFDTDCPIGFECIKQPYQMRGLCVKKE